MVPVGELDGYRRRSVTVKIVVVAVIVAAVATLLLLPARGEQVPDFELPLLRGDGTLASDQLKGAPVVLNFWASWCAPCREETPLLERTWRRYRDEGVQFVGVNVRDTESNAAQFVEEYDVTYPVVVDRKHKLADKLDVYGLPQTFFIDGGWRLSSVAAEDSVGRQGESVILGPISRRDLREQIETLLAKNNA